MFIQVKGKVIPVL